MLRTQVSYLIGVLVWLAQMVAIFAQAELAYEDRFFTPTQMMRHHGRGLPMMWHFGIMWGDIAISFLCYVVIVKYGGQWSVEQVAFIGMVAFVLSGVMHYQYLHDNISNSHMHDGKLTPAAYVHFAFMWVAMTVIGLFFLCTNGVSAWVFVLIAALLWIHVVLGTHLVVKLWSPPWFPPQPAADAVTLIVWVGAAVVLSGLAWWAI